MTRKAFCLIAALVTISTVSCESAVIPTTPTATPSPTATQTPKPPPPLLQTEGNQFVDEQGYQVILHGISIVDPIHLALGLYPDLGSWDEGLFQTLQAWGADVVRLPVHPPNYRQAGADRTLDILDQAVEWAAKYDLYVIIDFHGLGFPPDGTNLFDWAATDEDEMLGFWRLISQHFTGNNVVAFYEIFNEPGRETTGLANLEDWRTWKELCERVIGVIRENDLDTVILIGALNYGNNLFPVWQDPIDMPNIGYTCHPYPAQYRWIDWGTAFGRVSESYPVLLTEFGFENTDSTDELLQESSFVGPGRYSDALMAYTEERGLGWVAWVFSDVWPPRMLEEDSYRPTEFGAFIREQLLKYAGEAAP